MSTVSVVPWFCKEEWEFCRNNLFGSDVTMKKKAVEHLYIWKTRCSNLPMGVECTLVLMDTRLQDLQSDGDETRVLNRMNLELLYSMAVTKFVNFVTDSCVGNRSATTLQDVAKELGIPAWIVDLRHKAAHNASCLSLTSLREATDFCLKWLYDEYWANGDFEDICCQDENSFADVENCLDVHIMLKNHLLDDCERVSEIPTEHRQKINRFLRKTSVTSECDYLDDWSLNNVCKITVEKLSKILKKYPRKGELLVDKLLDEDYLLSPNNIDSTGQLEDSYVHVWNDIISVLCTSSKCYYFLQSLVKVSVGPIEPTIRKKCAAVHLNEIFVNILKQNRSTKAQSKGYQSSLKLRRPQLLEQEASALLKLVLQRPSDFIVIYLKNLLEIQTPSVDSSKIDKLLQLMDIYNGYSSLNVEDIEKDKKILINSFIPQDEEMSECDIAEFTKITNKEDISDSLSWSQTPIGILPSQQDFKPWLKLYGM
ncbi:uncharacterized protein LOC135846278 [Planococcus citri]|uniref:uncharacterized protein LOC135846278 n=1 Tax=Planococcus citri TaxID=170843 RepID=UPI0031F79ED2